MGLQVGDVIQDKYRICRLLGQGGMGAVFEGENLLIHRRVAIKVLHSAVVRQHGVVERFEREAQAAGRIGNDHILEVLDLGHLDDGERYMVMEFLDGETLEQRLKRTGPLDPRQLYPIVRQMLSGLTAAHAAGIIHRDLKPDNIFVMREKAGQPDFVKLIDFGISKFTATNSDMKMTATGAVMGTPYFMSPEQAKGSRDSDARSDLYSVGVILFRAVAGHVPFDAPNFNELLFKIVLAPTPRLSSVSPNVDPRFEEIVFRCMARNPTDRYQTTRELIAELDNWFGHGTALPASVPRSFQGAVATIELTEPYSGADTGRVSSAPSNRGRNASGGPRQSRPEAASYRPGALDDYTSGGSQGVVTAGTWSNTGYRSDRSASSNVWLMAGAAAVTLGITGLGYTFWANSRPAATALTQPVVVSQPAPPPQSVLPVPDTPRALALPAASPMPQDVAALPTPVPSSALNPAALTVPELGVVRERSRERNSFSRRAPAALAPVALPVIEPAAPPALSPEPEQAAPKPTEQRPSQARPDGLDVGY